ncbi:hypothetical protein LCGC14_2483150, partial [marine sediment metagenome]
MRDGGGGGLTSPAVAVSLKVHLAGLIVPVGDGAAKSLTFTEADETTVVLTFKDGTAEVRLTGGGLVQVPGKKGVIVTGTNVTLADIDLIGTSITSALTVKTKGGDGRATVANLTADGDLKSVTARRLDFTGDVDLAGTVGKLTLGNIADDHVIDIGGSKLSKAIKITLGRVANTILNCSSPIKSLTVIEWLDSNAVAGAVNASVIGKLTAKGAKANAKKGTAFSAGNFQADL